jgi:hypothetical protein
MRNKYYILYLLSVTLLWGCKKDNYPGGRISPFIALYDIRNLYKGEDVTLTMDNMFGSNTIAAMVVSDHSGGNLPGGLLVVQDSRRLWQLRGISIPLGADAAAFVPGDSVHINVEGAVLTRVDGLLQLTNITKDAITKISSGNPIPVNRVPINLILDNPEKFESTLLAVVKGGFNPLPSPADVLAGQKTLNDGFGNLTLYTDAKASFATHSLPVLANFFGIVFNSNGQDGQLIPRLHLRTADDVVVLSSELETASVLITGYIADVKGGDGNYEYVQLMATKDINFAQSPYALVVTNNANASAPTGYPAKGWATGNMRTYKFNLYQGTVKKGEFFYVGGAGKQINGSGSTSMAGSKWIRAFNYVNVDGDGFGAKTGGLFANSGNASGVAVFADSVVDVNSKPVDVIWIGTGGSLFTPGPPAMGYKIANTDFYDIKNPITLEEQPYYRSGSNTLAFVYNTPADQGFYNMLGGEYNTTLGRWTTARSQNVLLLTKQSPISEIEGEGATKIVE